MMRNKLFSFGLTIGLVAISALPTFANEEIAAGSQAVTRKIANLTPIDLVDAAYQGRLATYDIPEHLDLIMAIKANKINSQILVESAIAAGRLNSNAIDDLAYLNHVQSLLELKAKDN